MARTGTGWRRWLLVARSGANDGECGRRFNLGGGTGRGNRGAGAFIGGEVEAASAAWGRGNGRAAINGGSEKARVFLVEARHEDVFHAASVSFGHS
jgi:hypothetical protein